MGSKQRIVLLSGICLVIIIALVIWYWPQKTILDIPAMIGQPRATVEQYCSSQVGSPEVVMSLQLITYNLPIRVFVTYDAFGKAILIQVPPEEMEKLGYRYSNRKRWIGRFGFKNLPEPSDSGWDDRQQEYRIDTEHLANTNHGDGVAFSVSYRGK